MKKYKFFFCTWILLFFGGCAAIAQTTLKVDTYRPIESTIVQEKKFTFKAIETCNNPFNYKGDTISYFIGIKTPVVAQDTPEIFTILYEGCSYYWNKIFNMYSNEDKIKILEELLEYGKDTSLSGKKVRWYGKGIEGKKPESVSYTLQVEALYIITLLTTSNYAPYYSPYPVLIDSTTGKEITDNQKEINKVYKIYCDWVKKNKKTGFKNFRPPLYKSKYSWYASDERTKDVTISEIVSSGTIIGK
ncbi:MAG: hypothetical protein QM660_04885 [Dysgonomonas sp.]